MLVEVIIFILGKLKDCLMKILQLLLLQVITSSVQNSVFFGTKIKVEFNGSCLKQDKVTYDHVKLVNICTV